MTCTQALAGPYKGEDVREQLEERITEHAAWVEANGCAQLAAYADFVAARSGGNSATAAAPVDTPDSSNASSNGAPAAEEEGAAAGGTAAADGGAGGVHLDVYGGVKPQSLSLIDGLDVGDLTTDLETRVKDVVRLSIPACCNAYSSGGGFVAFLFSWEIVLLTENVELKQQPQLQKTYSCMRTQNSLLGSFWLLDPICSEVNELIYDPACGTVRERSVLAVRRVGTPATLLFKCLDVPVL